MKTITNTGKRNTITIEEIEASREWAIEAKAALDAALAVMAEVKATIAADMAAQTTNR